MTIARTILVKLAAMLAIAGLVSLAALAQEPPAKPDSYQLFDPIASVLQNPRCLNCHQAAAPRQKDTMIPHIQSVIRGADGNGARTLQCAACHQEMNSADGKVPGAKGWHLAPVPMVWEGLTRAQICRQMQDPSRNGNRKTAEEVIEHMKVDPLVLWAWNPGAGRSTPSITHEQFFERLEIWAKSGMPCPDDGPKAEASK
jgi:hypothetical protein